MRILILLALMLSSAASAAEFKLVRCIGQPNPDREKAWNGHVDRVSWADDERIVYWSKSGTITCFNVSTGGVEWTRKDVQEVASWSLSRKAGRLAYVEGGGIHLGHRININLIDCGSGKQLAALDATALAKLLGQEFAIASHVALSPSDGKLILGTFEMAYGRNGHIVDPNWERLESSFGVDAAPREWSLSPDGRFLSLIADEEVLCVHDLVKSRDVFFQGKRISVRPESQTFTVDAPFFSHIRSDGQTVIYSKDNSWATGALFVHELATKKTRSFDAHNGHIEMDVSFLTRRVVLTGTETGLTLMDFDGKVLIDLKKATLQRNVCVEFSPSAKQVVVGSWDNAVYVFEIVN